MLAWARAVVFSLLSSAACDMFSRLDSFFPGRLSAPFLALGPPQHPGQSSSQGHIDPELLPRSRSSLEASLATGSQAREAAASLKRM